MRVGGGPLGWMREFFGVERSGTQKISCSILQGNRKTEKAPRFRSSGTRVACLATQERCRRAARKRGVRSAPVFGFPPLCGVARGLPLAGGDGGNAPRHPASGMEARKGGDAAGGSVHDSPAASGGSPAHLPRPADARHRKRAATSSDATARNLRSITFWTRVNKEMFTFYVYVIQYSEAKLWYFEANL